MPLLSLLLLACAHRGAPRVDPEQPPILPAPEAEIYAVHLGTPRDPLVAGLAEGLPWDETLSGAAGSLALAADRAPDLGQASWAAYRAGYPYPLRSLSFAEVEPGQSPGDLRESVLASVRPGDQVGLARARVGSKDRWVALIGRASRPVEPFPRTLQRGEALRLQGAGLSRYTLTSPTGQLSQGELPAAPVLEEVGEWWVELTGDDGRVAVAVPVTVGMAAASAPPLDLPGAPANGPEDAMRQAREAIAQVRESFALRALGPDPTLDLLAREPLEMGAGWEKLVNGDRVHAAGFPEGGGFTCTDATVPLCVDRMLRAGAGRALLLQPEWSLLGGGAQVSASSVTLVLFLAAE